MRKILPVTIWSLLLFSCGPQHRHQSWTDLKTGEFNKALPNLSQILKSPKTVRTCTLETRTFQEIHHYQIFELEYEPQIAQHLLSVKRWFKVNDLLKARVNLPASEKLYSLLDLEYEIIKSNSVEIKLFHSEDSGLFYLQKYSNSESHKPPTHHTQELESISPVQSLQMAH